MWGLAEGGSEPRCLLLLYGTTLARSSPTLHCVKTCAILVAAMPSARASRFVDTETLMGEGDTAALARGEGPDQRSRPPASAGLRAPSDKLSRADQRDRDAHPGTPGPLSDDARDRVVALTLRMMNKLTPKQIAVEAGTSTDAKLVKGIIKSARRSLTERAEFYVEAHAIATMQAALEGDARPAQWALEHIGEGGDRVVDAPKKEEAPSAPTFNIGFQLGGVPLKPTLAITDGEVVTP